MMLVWVVVACKTLDVPTDPTLISNTSGQLVGKKRWPTCTVTWGIGSTVGGNASNAPTEAYVAAFDAFNKAGTFLAFQRNSTTAKSTIAIVLSIDGQMSKANTEGLFSYKTASLASSSGSVQAGFTIFVNTTNKWTAPQLQSLIMNQLGEILGLSSSPDPTALMYPQLNKDAPTTQITPTDLAALRALYPASGLPAVTTGQPYLPVSSKVYVADSPITNADNVPPVLTAGYCLSTTNPTPTIENSKYIEASNITIGLKTTSTALWDLQANTRYYLRAYARNACGTGYGQTITFTKP